MNEVKASSSRNISIAKNSENVNKTSSDLVRDEIAVSQDQRNNCYYTHGFGWFQTLFLIQKNRAAIRWIVIISRRNH